MRQFEQDYVQRESDLRDGGHDAKSLQSLLHPLIATSASMGLMRLSGFCRDIIDQCQNAGYAPPRELADQMRDCYNDGIAALHTHIDPA